MRRGFLMGIQLCLEILAIPTTFQSLLSWELLNQTVQWSWNITMLTGLHVLRLDITLGCQNLPRKLAARTRTMMGSARPSVSLKLQDISDDSAYVVMFSKRDRRGTGRILPRHRSGGLEHGHIG